MSNVIRDVDYVVVGLGSVGSMALWQLAGAAPEGTSILGLEQFGRLHPFGSYAGESRLYRMALKEGDKYIELARAARPLWLELNELSGRDVFVPAGALSIGAADSSEIAATLAAIDKHDLDYEMLSGEELRERYPQFDYLPDDVGIVDPNGGGIRPELAVATAQKQAEKLGAEIMDNTPVLSLDYTAKGVIIETEAGLIAAKRVICTAGSWTGQLVEETARLINVRRVFLTWFAPEHIDSFTPTSLPVFLRDMRDPDGTLHHTFGAPSLDGYSVKVTNGSMGPDYDSVADLDLTVPQDYLSEASADVRSSIPGFFEGVPRASVHHDGFTADNTPIIDTFGAVTVAAGMSGRGMKFAPIYGQLCAQLALGQTPPLYNAEEFSIAAHTHAVPA